MAGKPKTQPKTTPPPKKKPSPRVSKQPGSFKQQAEAAGLDVNAYVQQVLRPAQAAPDGSE